MDVLTAENFQLASCQATLFTPDEEVSSARLMKGLLPRWIERFDADPTVVPAVEGIPREVPRLILESKSGVWRCEIASARINLFWRKSGGDVSVPTLGEFFTDATKMLIEYWEFLGSRVGRMAGVLNRYAGHPTPGLFLASHFCQDRWLNGPLARTENFELHVHKTYVLVEKFHMNSWVRSKTGRATFGQESHPIILIEQDLNTLAEEMQARAFGDEDIKRFFSVIAQEFDAILRLYYPAGGRP